MPALREATSDLSWLLGRGYSAKAAHKLVGDRYQLIDRQRRAVGACAASDEAARRRREKRIEPSRLQRRTLWVDGYNVLLTIETAISGGVVLRGRDGLLRDLSALSRHYRQVGVTRPALELLGSVLADWRLGEVRWLFDRPISNSGRLCRTAQDMASANDWPWHVELHDNPDAALLECGEPVATADTAILDGCGCWVNLASEVVEARVPEVWMVDLA